MRKTEIITIQDEGRDKGKAYLITEMPASQGEKWAMRALLALSHSGVDIGMVAGAMGAAQSPEEDARKAGMQGLAMMGIQSLIGLQFHEAEPLLDEMFQCIRRAPDPGNLNLVRPLVEDDIEEIGTRLKLRRAWYDLHVGFLKAAAASKPTTDLASAA